MKLDMLELITLQRGEFVEIKSVRISGFRNIKNETISFEKVTALVGLNGYGKSNILDAIDFGFDFIHATNHYKASMMSSKKCIPILKINAGQDYEFNVNCSLVSAEKTFNIEYGYTFSWGTNKSQAKVKAETLKVKQEGPNQKFNTYISRTQTSALYRTSLNGRCSKQITIEDNGLIINKLLALDELFYLDIVKQINEIQFFVERHLDASDSFMPDPVVIKGFQELELQGIRSIPRAIFFLKRDYNDRFEMLINAFRQLFPTISSVSVKEVQLDRDANFEVSEDAPFTFSNNIYAMSIVDERLAQPIGFQYLSDGTKRVFLMLTFAIIADIKKLSMIAIEEPENSIHPSLFQNYLDVLSQLVDQCKIVFTSHSPYIIQYLDPSSIYISVPNTSGEACFRKIAPTKTKRLLREVTEYGCSLGDYVFNVLSSDDLDEFVQEYT